MIIYKKILSCATLAILLTIWLVIPSPIASASVAVTFVPNYDTGKIMVKFSRTLSTFVTATLYQSNNTNVFAAELNSVDQYEILDTTLVNEYGKTISVVITDSTVPSNIITTTTTYRVPEKSEYAADSVKIDYANETISGVKPGADLYLWGLDDYSDGIYAPGAGTFWSGENQEAKVLPNNSIPNLSPNEKLSVTQVHLHLRKVEDGKFWSDVIAINVKNRDDAPDLTALDIDFTKEQLKPAVAGSLQYSEDRSGPFINLTALNLVEKKKSYLGETLYLRKVAVTTAGSEMLASVPMEFVIPQRSDTPTDEAVDDLFDRSTETFYHNVKTNEAGGTIYEYRLNKKDSWKPVPFNDGSGANAPISLEKLGAGLDKGIKKLEVRRGGTFDGQVTNAPIPAQVTKDNGLMASEAVMVNLSRPKGPKKSDVRFVYADFAESSPSARVVLGDNLLGVLVTADQQTPALEIAEFKNKKAGKFVPVQTDTAAAVTDGKAVYAAPPSDSLDCPIVVGNAYAIRYAASTTGDEKVFASKPTIIKLGKQKKAGKYSYIPLTETMKGVKDGRTLYLESNSAKFSEVATDEWTLYTTADQDGNPVDSPFKPGDNDKYLYFRNAGADGKNPAGEISPSVKIPKKSSPLSVTLGSTKPTADNQIVIDMNKEKVMVPAGKIAYRLKVDQDAIKKPSWRILKKAEIPLKTFIPKTEEITYEFIVAGDSKGSTSPSKSNSDPFEVKFQPRPENPVAEDLVYDYADKKYTAQTKSLLVSADGKTNWTLLKTSSDTNPAGVTEFPADKLDKPIVFKIAPTFTEGVYSGPPQSIGEPASAKALKFKFAATPAAPAVTLSAQGDGKTGKVDGGDSLEWATNAKATKWNSALDKIVKDGETIYIRTPATSTSPSSKPAKVTWQAVAEQ